MKMSLSRPRMNRRMSALLQNAGVFWPIMVPSLAEVPAMDIVDDCVLLRSQWETNRHLKVKDFHDKTGFECFINHVQPTFTGTSESLISCLEYATMVRQTLMPMMEVRRFRVIVSLSEDDSDCTIRFHQIRSGETFMAQDLEGYKCEAIMVFDIPSALESASPPN
jgi:hypothetical protein